MSLLLFFSWIFAILALHESIVIKK
jgi:hypothetical protein